MQDIKTHYAILNAQEESVRRIMPIAIVVYHMYLKVVHSGMTMEEVLSLDDEHLGQFFSGGLQITCDAGLFPYERDFIPNLCLSLFHGIDIAAVGTEDMVRCAPTRLLCPHFVSDGWMLAGLAALAQHVRRQDDSRQAAHQGQRQDEHG